MICVSLAYDTLVLHARIDTTHPRGARLSFGGRFELQRVAGSSFASFRSSAGSSMNEHVARARNVQVLNWRISRDARDAQVLTAAGGPRGVRSIVEKKPWIVRHHPHLALLSFIEHASVVADD